MDATSPLFPPGTAVHFVRATLDRARPKRLHGHDNPELVWVQNGRVRHHLATGSQDLGEGDMIFVQPGHRHALQARADDTMIVSLTFAAGLVADIGARHASLSGHLFWSASDTPAQARRDIRALADLNQSALRLHRSTRDALAAEAFLLPLCATLRDDTANHPDNAPDWLAAACRAARDPAVFRDGAAGFVRATGRTHAHVSRTARAVLGQSPSDYVNAIRMDFAARQLASSPDSIAEIAADCGLPNLSHFHKLFRGQHGLTPGDYRRTWQRNVVQPDTPDGL